MADPPRGRPGPARRFRDYLWRHPILFLLMLTPGIPEYLSGSSKASGFLTSPVVAGAFLLLNVGMYGPGVLLIREARIRWNAGWGAVALLGVAYAIMEEGIADATIFNPTNPNVGVLGSYGHFLGVNWVWLPGVVMIHLVFSLGIPLYLFHLARPDLDTTSLIRGPRLPMLVAVLAIDDAIVTAIGVGYLGWFDGWTVIGACLLVILACALVAWKLPAGWPVPRAPGPRGAPWSWFVAGGALFPSVVLLEGALGSLGAPAGVTVGATLLELAAYVLLLGTQLGRAAHDRQLIAFVAGAILPIGIIGFFAGLPVPVILVGDGLAVVFLRELYRRASLPRPATAQPLGGVVVPPRPG